MKWEYAFGRSVHQALTLHTKVVLISLFEPFMYADTLVGNTNGSQLGEPVFCLFPGYFWGPSTSS